MRFSAFGLAAASVALAACQQQTSNEAQSSQNNEETATWPGEWVSASGDISLPTDFDTWPTLGSWSTADAEGVTNGMHQVYASPGTIEGYRQTGAFPDGAMLVKEVRGADTAALTTGAASYATDEQVWFVMVKDGQGPFTNNPLWGNGWGWALFEAGDRTIQTAQNFEIDCLSCHIPAQDSDWVYVDAYPVLRADGAAVTPAWQDTP